MAKLWRKLNRLVFFYDTVYMYVVGRVEPSTQEPSLNTSSLIPDTPPLGSQSAYFVCDKVRQLEQKSNVKTCCDLQCSAKVISPNPNSPRQRFHVKDRQPQLRHDSRVILESKDIHHLH